MIHRRWVHHAALWTAFTRVSTGFVATHPVGGCRLFSIGSHHTTSILYNQIIEQERQFSTTALASIHETSSNLRKANKSFSSKNKSSPPSPPKRLWSRKWRRPLGATLSFVGFCQSAIYAVLTPQRPPKVRRVIKALRRYLRETSIDQEFTSILNHRLVGNLLILRRIQRQFMTPRVAHPSSMTLPCPFESLR